jgi:hypothetical protein
VNRHRVLLEQREPPLVDVAIHLAAGRGGHYQIGHFGLAQVERAQLENMRRVQRLAAELLHAQMRQFGAGRKPLRYPQHGGRKHDGRDLAAAGQHGAGDPFADRRRLQVQVAHIAGG